MHKLEKYLLEKENLTYNDEGDWCYSYTVLPALKDLYVNYLYLEEDSRNKERASEIWEVVSAKALEHDCVRVSCDVDRNHSNPTRSLKFLRGLGFVQHSMDEDFIYLFKNI